MATVQAVNGLQRTGRPRVAWTGPLGAQGGPWFSTSLFRLLLERDFEVEFFGIGEDSPFDELLGSVAQDVRYHGVPMEFSWGRWYSRTRPRAFVSSTVARLRAYRSLSRAIAARHREAPFDVWFQMSQPETFLRRGALEGLPPIVVHPCTHAFGELRWVVRERAIARRYDSAKNLGLALTYLSARSLVQRFEFRKPALVIGPSEVFVKHIARDYGVPESRLAVLRHPIDLARFNPGAASRAEAGRPIKLLFVSRMSVRKGLDMVMELSRRLADLDGRCQIDLIGGATLWSDYTALATEPAQGIARYVGPVPAEDLVGIYRTSDALLLPSRYEPGALVVGEALAVGLPVVLSDQVGPGEVVDPRVCRTYPDGDLDAFERCVRELLRDIEGDPGVLRRCAAEEARRLFADRPVGERLASLIEQVADGTTADLEDRWSIADAAPGALAAMRRGV